MFDLLTSLADSTGVIGSILLLLVSYVGKKYLIPFLLVAKRKQYASYIAVIADEVTDDLRARYPNNEWLQRLDAAVDRLMEICDIKREIAKRATHAAVGRKK